MDLILSIGIKTDETPCVIPPASTVSNDLSLERKLVLPEST